MSAGIIAAHYVDAAAAPPILLRQEIRAIAGGSSATPSVAVTVVSASDVLVLMASKSSVNADWLGVSGCGATWTVVQQPAHPGGTKSFTWLIVGTNPTPGAGTVTMSFSNSLIRVAMNVTLWAGLSGVVSLSTSAAGSGVTVDTGTVSPVLPSGLVIGGTGIDTNIESTYTPSPASGWTDLTFRADSTSTSIDGAYRLATAGDAHRLTGPSNDATARRWAGVIAHLAAA